MKGRVLDRQQNFWQLAAIQSSALGLPGILIGSQLAKSYGAGTAVVSICIGNLLLWIIGLAIISMAARERNNALENVKGFLGGIGSQIATLVLIIAFLTWYILQLKSTSSAIDNLFINSPRVQKYTNLRLGVLLGIITAWISMGGIKSIKKITTVCFPFLLVFLVFLMFFSKKTTNFQGTWDISFSAIISTTTVTLPGIINLPTFFRHSKSRAHSFLALILITIFVSLFQILSIFIGFSEPENFFSEIISFDSAIYFQIVLGLIFVILAMACVNLVNIYFASAAWEQILPHNLNPKEYVIVGLFGTAGYAFLQAFEPMQFIENLSDNCIANLGIVLLIAFLVKIIAKHRPRPLEKFVSGVCWLLGCITTLLALLNNPNNENQALFLGIGTSIVAFLFILFIEETIWSTKKLNFFEKKD